MPRLRLMQACREPTDFPTCVMTAVPDFPAAIYGFPSGEEDFYPVCMVIFRPAASIAALGAILRVCDLLAEDEEVYYVPQYFATRVELHFCHLNTFAVTQLIRTITFVRHDEIGDWASMPSTMGILQVG
eukprot:GFUD01112710.1.p2 GENE.GFUD01112710.1~~GFUD01112710.1.p2  ORF type:complete len:129 (+),score=15.63 GFUD01112710.1:357-743(+)